MSIDIVISDIKQSEEALIKAVVLLRTAHRSVMGLTQHGGFAHPGLALIELSLRAASQSNDAARYARQTFTNPNVTLSQQPTPSKEEG